jgi:Skp family chaperone for outer membrane proteins
MKILKLSFVAVVLTGLTAAPSFAQAGAAAPKPQTPPPAAKPPAQPPAQPAAPKPEPVPFPADAKYAFVDMQGVASSSVAGKAASAKLKALTEAKQKELGDKSKQLQALTTKRDTSLGVMNETARQQLDKDIDKLQREIQFAQSNAQADVQALNNELMSEFQQKLAPIIEAVAKEKGLYMIFTPDSGFAFLHPGLNITDDVIKRLDAKK